jgi:nucleoside-diphosphate-sugar epimerase
MKTDSFKTKRDWTYARDIPLVLNNIMSSKRKHPQIINLVSPFIKSDLQMMKIINKNMHLSNISIKENKKYKNKIKPTRSKYLYKFKFTEWTSPEEAIKKILNSNT